ncbi:MAG: thioredoxin domain-containing protein [Thermodesulfobacteriota bacterium]
MKRSRIAIVTTVSLCFVAGSIIVWAAYQNRGTAEKQGYVKSFTDENFEKEVVEASMVRPVVVDFYAEWCSPCKMLDPIMRELADDLKDRVIVGKLDTDKNLIARRFGISRIPTIFIIRNGEIKNAFFGPVPKEMLIRALAEYGS